VFFNASREQATATLTRKLDAKSYCMKSRGLQLAAFGLLTVVLLAGFVRLRLLSIPLERDEGEFAYMGQLMLQGIPPYKLAFNIKLPGTYAAYAIMMGLFGQTTAGIHFGFLLVNLVTIALLFLIARQLLDTESAMIACICYALFSLSPGVLGLQGHATHLIVLTALAGLWVLLKARATRRTWSFCWSGIFFGLSFLCKQPGIFFATLGAAILLRDAVEAPASDRARQLRRFVAFSAGVALPFLLTCFWMWPAGTFRRFWFWTMIYAPYHAGSVGKEQVWWQLNDFTRHGGALELWALAAVAGLVVLILDNKRTEAQFFIVSLLGFSLMALLVSLYLFRHYFIVLLPVVSLLVALTVRAAARWAGWATAAGCFAVACALFIFVNRAIWFQMSPDEASRSLYQREPFPEAVEIARYIRAHSGENDSIEVLGSEPEIYFYSHRHSASGYLYMYDLTKPTQFAPAMQREMMHDIEAAKPLYLIDVHVPTSWAITMNSDPEIIQWSSDYARGNYDLAGKVVLGAGTNADYLWGPEASTKETNAWMYVSILKRKPSR
jgi:4-amino-4-deoxy-L-arabinose transferase-like glycosyltransferase